MKEGTLTLADGRTVGYADYGIRGQLPIVHCHGGPSNRQEPLLVPEEARRAGLRFIGIDRPGYGRSTPQPGRTIGGWVPDALAVVDALNIDRFLVVGCSTGGAYALALASRSDRVLGAIACCAVSDMRWPEGKAMVHGAQPVWNAPDRDTAQGIVETAMGADGGRIRTNLQDAELAATDRDLLADPEFAATYFGTLPDVFAFRGAGYTDDRLADRDGWTTFDVGAIRCPVVVLHGASDTFVPVAHAYHTASLVPGAELRIVDALGHFSILLQVEPAARELASRVAAVAG
jgi:pimeloyl-ACP methyl ester carboxylesterase